MKIKELFEKSVDAQIEQRVSNFIDRWYEEHELVSSSEIEKMIRDFPDCAVVNDYIERYIGIHPDIVKENNLYDEEAVSHGHEHALDPQKVDEYIAKHEPNRYVSGSETNRGLSRFYFKGGLDSRDYNVVVGYEGVNGLNLKKLIQRFISNPNSKQESIVEVEEVIFKPTRGETVDWVSPE